MSYAPYIAKIKKVLYMQVVVALAVPGLWVMFGSSLEVKSALLGGLIGVFPNAIFAFKLLQATGQDSRMIAKAFYWGEFLKLIATGLLFGVVIMYVEIAFLPLLLCFAAVLSVFWFSLLTIK